ncbi:hypothetical protein [Salinisphaera sp. G21_0]|uniref:hypothetical protein n=1 Tax=Salinisphaera sp. G21_0 TaxID=2821094 RepID=UPI001AD9DCA8|nr:hypothetical protein [Salinisphaera sp. G21_0]MBO9482122.1 hypothetical protein [Salinisphaera sp. G21_0]
MKTLRTLVLATAVSAGLLGSAGVIAATQGTAGPTSKGTFDIKFEKGSVAKVWGFSDIPLNGTQISESTAATDLICVFTNKAVLSNDYQLEIASLNKFQLVGAGSDGSTAIDYGIKVSGYGQGSGSLDNSSITPGTDLNVISTTNLKAGALLTQPKPNLDCANENAQIAVWVTSDISSLAGGSYSDTVTLVVTPQ